MKRLLSVTLIISLLAMFPWVTPAVAEDAPQTVLPSDEVMPWENNSDNVYNKIHVYLGDEDYATIDSAEELEESIEYVNSLGSATQTYSANARSAASEEKLQLTVQFESDLNKDPTYLSLLSERDSLETMEEVRAWRGRLNEYTKSYHNSLISNVIASESTLSNIEYDHIDYSPFVCANIDFSDINGELLVSLADSSNTENIIIDTQGEFLEKSTWSQVTDSINATSIINQGRYNGTDVRVGIFEAEGVCDSDNDFFVENDIEVINKSGITTISQHATSVTSIAASIAPAATYYVGTPEDGRLDLSWFISNQCDVVNCSLGRKAKDTNNDGIYENEDLCYLPHVDGLIDYQAYYNCLSVVISSGNYGSDNTSPGYNPDNEIQSPGYAYNAITVGGLAYNSTAGGAYPHNKASYVSDEGIMKPNISALIDFHAPATNVYGDGTSYAAPQVTGAIALMIDKRPVNTNFPMRILAMLTASADKVIGYTENLEYFHNRTGAGIVNVERFLNNLMFTRYDSIDTPYDTPIIVKEVELNAGDEIQIAVAWTVTGVEVENYTDNPISAAVPVLTNYELALTGINGSPLAVSCSFLEDSNVELIRYTAGSTGTYEIVVFLGSVMSEDVYIDEVTMVYNIN